MKAIFSLNSGSSSIKFALFTLDGANNPMLSAGGTRHHSELLKPFGLDASEPDFWTLGLSLIERMIGELEAMG